MNRSQLVVIVALVTLSFVWACGTPAGMPDAGSGGGSVSGGGVATGGGTVSAGGTAGGTASAGGSAGGSVTAGGIASGGGAAGGSIAGGSAGGAVAGGVASAGGTASAGGSASAGGTASAGGVASAGGAAAGGSAGGMVSTNMPPFLSGIVVTAVGSSTPITGVVYAGRQLQVTANAFDPENDPLTYQWTAPDGGTLTDATLETARWSSPQVNSIGMPFPEFSVRVSVTDGNSAPVSFEQTIQVRAPFLFELMAFNGVLGKTTPGGCSNSSCHGGTPGPTNAAASAMQLQPTNPSATRTVLLGNTAKSGCFPTARVSPASPSNSLLIHKVDPSEILPFNCGVRMPQNLPTLPANDIVSLRSWIAAGALQ